mmetsp:Transcript_35755/g.116369  ORF Transcript_35755/g.116369 Transcript_35755/m.116369 type:complete len:211 (-) Transcript_35755:408-1040(-)
MASADLPSLASTPACLGPTAKRAHLPPSPTLITPRTKAPIACLSGSDALRFFDREARPGCRAQRTPSWRSGSSSSSPSESPRPPRLTSASAADRALAAPERRLAAAAVAAAVRVATSQLVSSVASIFCTSRASERVVSGSSTALTCSSLSTGWRCGWRSSSTRWSSSVWKVSERTRRLPSSSLLFSMAPGKLSIAAWKAAGAGASLARNS